MEDLDEVIRNLANPDPEVREASLDVIGELHPHNAVDLLSQSLSDPEAEVRGTAACNLGLISDERAIPFLINVARHDSAEHVRAEALASLAGYKSPEILRCLVDEVQRKKQSRRPRQEVAKQLANYDSKETIRALSLLLKDEDVFVREYSAESLFKLNRPELRSIWMSALQDRSHEVREIARAALTGLGEP